MRAAILGSGPGGLHFAISLKRRDPVSEVVVVDRKRPDGPLSWGGATLEMGNIYEPDHINSVLMAGRTAEADVANMAGKL